MISLTLVDANQMADWARVGARYRPSVIGGVLIVLVALVARGVVYFVSVTLALDALGYNTVILNTMAQAVAVGLGLGIALAVGISVGLGGQDYVADHIDEWASD